MIIRQAQSLDAQIAGELIFSSATKLLGLMFNVDEEHSALGFLKTTLCQHDGQFGYRNHWVLEKNAQVVAIASAWHCEHSAKFHKATLQSIADYYGPPHALEIIRRCQVLQNIFPAPQKSELCIGHFAVTAFYQRQGLGTHLIAHMHKLAINKGKKTLTLDVELANQAAHLFYQRLGFRTTKQQVLSQQLSDSGIGPYSHMVLPL